MEKMKAVTCSQYGPPEVLLPITIDKPVPKPHEVLIKVHATTVTVADTRIRGFRVPPAAWLPARFVLGLRRPNKPVLGMELAGVIVSIGSQVKLYKPGDAVFAATFPHFGGYAEYVCLPETGRIAPKPTNSSYEAAAALPVGACTALHYLRRGKISKGQKVLVYGASGSVGSYAVQLARHFGAAVTGVCSTENLDLVKSLGAEKVIDYTDEDFTKKLEQYDIIFLAIDKCPFSICEKALKPEGVYLNITTPLRSLPMLWTTLTSKKKVIVGENAPESAQNLVFLKDLVEAGKLCPVIDKTYTFDQLVEAHRYVDLGHKKGNVAISIK